MTHSILHRLVPAGVALAMACATSEPVEREPPADDPTAGVPDLAPGPRVVTFARAAPEGVVSLLDYPHAVTERVTLHNQGDGALRLLDLSLDDPTGPFSLTLPADLLVPAGEGAAVTVTFAPTAAGVVLGTLRIESDDPDEPVVEVALEGEGMAPAVEAWPVEHDFGPVAVGCDATRAVRLTSTGNLPLVVRDWTLSPTGGAFSVEAPGEVGLEPGDPIDVPVTFAPLADGARAATLTVHTNAADPPALALSFSGTGAVGEARTDRFDQPATATADVLFAVDRSCSLDDDLAAFEAEAGAFLAALRHRGVDHQVAVTVQDDGCVEGPDLFVDATFSASEAQQTLSTMIALGVGYSSNAERQFMLLEAALTEAAGPGGCNHGLVRPPASLHLIGVSDEAEQSVHPYSYYVGLFQSLKAFPGDVVIHGIGGDYPAGCGVAQAYTGVYEATLATGGHLYSVCESDWADDLADAVAASGGPRATFPLSARPVPETLRVAVDGVTRASGWTFLEADVAVAFDPDAVPPGGAEVTVDYAVQTDCEE